MTPDFIPFGEGNAILDWLDLIKMLESGHARPRAKIEDVFLYRDKDTLLNRSAWIEGMGVAVKACTIFPGNTAKGKPMIAGAVNLFSDDDGALEAVLDFALVTKWKTAGDSLLAATKLARKDSHNILVVGAGTVGRSLIEAYGAAFPGARFTVWNRSAEGAARFADQTGATVASDLETAVKGADIVTCATMSSTPILKGDWLQPGQHIDLIGAYRPDMREADDTAIKRARVFVDNRKTVTEHIGELRDPIANGVIPASHVIADYYDIGAMARQNDAEITLFKNGGGAHLDLMTSRYILDAWRGHKGTA